MDGHTLSQAQSTQKASRWFPRISLPLGLALAAWAVLLGYVGIAEYIRPVLLAGWLR